MRRPFFIFGFLAVAVLAVLNPDAVSMVWEFLKGAARLLILSK